MKHLIKLVAATFVCAILYVGLAGMSSTEEEIPALRFESLYDSIYEEAVSLIKRYETIHQPRNWPFVGYGHKILPGEKFSRQKALSEEESDRLLRSDLDKNISQFSSYGKDSLLLGVLAYNIGPGAVARSEIAKKLAAGDRDIYELYLSHCRYRGKAIPSIRRRRQEEYDLLFNAFDERPAEKTDSLGPIEPIG